MALRRGFQDNFDWPLFVTTAAISVVGVVNLYSATSASAPGLRDMYIQQIYWMTLGAGVAVLVAAIDYRHFERYGWIAYGIGVAMLILVFLLAREIRGSQRWIPVGSFS
ncbi:MAG TPA: FtsW/RodA/SpoVE family cell cycle protein, partial [Polyangiales bacterium]